MTKLQRLIKIAAMTAVLCISVYAVPPILVIGQVPFTIQTFMIFLIAYLFDERDAFMIVFLYVGIGLLGLPVFAGGQSGLSAILGPTGGFIVLFPLMAYLIAKFKSIQKNFFYDTIMGSLFGIILLYGLSAIWLAYFVSITYLNALYLLFPFVPLDLIKLVIAHIVYQKMPSFYAISTH